MISILEFPLRTSNFISNLGLFPPHRYSESAPIRTKGMAEDSTKDVKESTTSTDTEIEKAKKKKGLLSRLWGAISRLHGDNFEKRLQYISKEETAILSRISRRSNNWRRITKQLISFSVLLEAIAIGYAIMTTRTLDLNWKIRALRLLPMFLLPVLLSITYFTFRGFIRMLDQKDHKTLEKLRAERQAKIDELKEKTNYYITQQLIQKYDTDPAAKAAAATVLASKLGADSGLKVYLGDDPNQNVAIGKSKEMEVSRTDGLRNRKPSSSMQNASTRQGEEEMHNQVGLESTTTSPKRQVVVDHHPQSSLSSIHDGGWIARFAALLVGEDPTQSYALICGNCHKHNGLARKEEFPYVCYYCPHCHALNRGKQSERVWSSNSPSQGSSVVEEGDVAQICDELIAASSPLAVGDTASGSRT